MAQHVCPWYVGYFLLNPMRRFVQDPEAILRPYVNQGMTVADIGSAMGFFSLPLSRLVGEGGRVVCIDLQERMIRTLKKRAAKAGLAGRMEFRLCTESSLEIDDMSETIDFALAFAVVHEVPDPRAFFSQIKRALKVGACVLVAEPTGHVKEGSFHETISIARSLGLAVETPPEIWRSHCGLLRKL